MDPLIRFDHVSKCYVSGASQLCPLDGVSLDIAHGERVALMGKSGSGKTTFLNIVGGVDLPTRGRVLFNGQELTALSPKELAMYRRQEVGFIFQAFNLFPTLTVGENLTLPLDLLGDSNSHAARELLDAVGLEDQWNKFPEQLSGGEQQRVAIARALVKNPRVILADEPTGNLDLDTGEEILRLIDRICREHSTTLIMATHSVEALWLAGRRFRLKGGKLVEEVI